MKIVKITTEWEDGRKYSIVEPEVTHLLNAGGNVNIQIFLLMAFALNLDDGYHWKGEE